MNGGKRERNSKKGGQARVGVRIPTVHAAPAAAADLDKANKRSLPQQHPVLRVVTRSRSSQGTRSYLLSYTDALLA